VIADSRVLTSSAPNFEALLTDLHDAGNGVPRTPGNNEQITYKIVRLNNVEHVILDNAHHLANFRGQQAIERLHAFAGMLAAKLNRPVTIPAFLMLEDSFEAVESGVRGLLNRDPHQSTRLDPLMVSTPFDEAPPKCADVKKDNPELSALLATKDDLPFKVSVKQDAKLESFGQLANAILTQRNCGASVSNGGRTERIDEMLSVEPRLAAFGDKEPERRDERMVESLGVLGGDDYDFGFDPFETNAALFNNMDFNVNELDFDGMSNGLLTSNNPPMGMMPTSMLASCSNLFSMNLDNEDDAVVDGEERFRARSSNANMDE
jgi:hypothetical protein